MLAHLSPATPVTITMQGATQPLAMRAVYVGTDANGTAHLTGVGVMADATFTAAPAATSPSGWALGNGRLLLSVTAR